MLRILSKIITAAFIVVIFGASGYFYLTSKTPHPSIPKLSEAPTPSVSSQATRVIAANLKVPWEIVFLPDNSALITERPGTIKKLNSDGTLIPNLQINIPEVKQYGEGGLLGIALDPNFISNNSIYIYYTYSSDGNNTLNKVVKYQFDGSKLSQQKIMLDKIPGAVFHNGGRIKFGPDGFFT